MGVGSKGKAILRDACVCTAQTYLTPIGKRSKVFKNMLNWRWKKTKDNHVHIQATVKCSILLSIESSSDSHSESVTETDNDRAMI